MDKQLIKQFLEKEYGWQILSQEVIQETDYNLSLKVQTISGNNFVRFGKIISAEDVAEEVALLLGLKDSSLVTKLKLSLSGKSVTVPDFCKTCAVFEFIEGNSFHDPNYVPSKQQCFEAAAVLQRLHSAGINLKSRTHKTLTSEIDNFLQQGYVLNQDFILELKNARGQAMQFSEENNLVHGDFRIKNIIWDQTMNNVKAVVDFEWYFSGPKEYDLGLMLVEWSYPDGGQDFDRGIIETILEGYSSAGSVKLKLPELKFWMYYSALCDAVTFLKRKVGSGVIDPNRSFMYKKARKALELDA